MPFKRKPKVIEEEEQKEEIEEENITDLSKPIVGDRVSIDIADDDSVRNAFIGKRDFDEIKQRLKQKEESMSELGREITFIRNKLDELSDNQVEQSRSLFSMKEENKEAMLNEIVLSGELLTDFNSSIEKQLEINKELIGSSNDTIYNKGYGEWSIILKNRVFSLDEFLVILREKSKNINISLHKLVQRLKESE